MPEGPEIRRAADQVAAAISGKKVKQVFFAFDHLKHFEPLLTGTTVRSVETFGKAMLTQFSSDLNIYTHNQLYGQWQCRKAGEQPRTARQLRLAIRNSDYSALLYSASDITVLTDVEVSTHPFISRLGPDVLSPKTKPQTIINQLQHKRFRNRQLGNVLTDQSFVAGLGNYLRCEVLFATGLSPAQRPVDLNSQQIERLAKAILNLPRQSYETKGITNDLHRARQMIQEGASFEEARFQVFRREGKPCYHCGTAIVRSNYGGQPTYLCPVCQDVTY